MKRIARLLLLLTPLTGFACGDDVPADPGGGDSGVLLPDATIVVPTDGGGSDVLPAPTLTSVRPSSGPEQGGTRVTLRGTAFAEPAEVRFGDVSATGVVVLDEVSIAATAPPGAIGPVTVKVTTPGGSAERENAFRYHRDLAIIAVTPARLPEEGGVLVTIVGRGFDASTVALLDRRPLAGLRLVDAEHLEGYAPGLAPGRPELRVFHKEAEARRSDLVVVYGTPDLAVLAPGYGPIAGGAAEELSGDGFEGAMRVTIGSTVASALAIDSGERLRFDAPPLAAGVYDVTVENADAAGTLRGGYVAYDPSRAGLELVGVTPSRTSSAGGDVVAIVGHGIPAGATVRIGGRAATVSRVAPPNAITAIVPAGLAAGPADVQVRTSSGTVTLAGALTVFEPIAVDRVEPAAGPVAGGTAVTITGRGFTGSTRVQIGDVALAGVTVVSDTEITGTTVAGAHGASDVVVASDDTRGALAAAFRFEEAFEVIRVEPAEGSIAGNTYVSVLGRGFDAPAAVRFGGSDGLAPRLENGAVIGVRTAPATTGRVSVAVSTGGGDATIEDAFEFFDPRIVTGGAWGGPIEGAVNVGVVEPGSGRPIPGMVVQLGYDADPLYRAVTDQNGLATISSPELRGPQTITAGQNEVQFTTFMELNARNLTMFASPYPRSQGPEDPVPPCPMGGQPPTIRGHLFKFKSSLDPETHPGWTAIARITYSQPNVFQANPPQPAEQVDFVESDGEEWEIVAMRVGTVAVYAVLYDFNPETQELIPRKMGIARQVPAAIGTVTADIDIELDIDLDQSLAVRLDQPPEQTPGPSINAVFPYLNLGSEGVVPFPATIAEGQVTISGLPNLAASQFFYMGGSFTRGAGNRLLAPYSLTLRESGEPFDVGLDLGPFLGMPEDASPKPFEVARGGRFGWAQGGIAPDITTVEIVDQTTVSGCCCADMNMNGQCETAEPQMCGGLPQEFTRWMIYGQGGLESYTMPRMPPELHAFDSPQSYDWLVQQAVAPRFTYDEFIYNQFSPFFWSSWSYWYSRFLSKEETP